MFFCEECKQKNQWPGIFAHSYGTCEMCGTRAPCYDVPSKHLPLPPRSHDTHITHCCQKHGCKYYGAVGGPNSCPVMKNGGQQYMCEHCHEEIYEDGGYEDAHLMNELYRKGEQHAHERFRLIIAEADRFKEKHERN
jgi:hypothetical protein